MGCANEQADKFGGTSLCCGGKVTEDSGCDRHKTEPGFGQLYVGAEKSTCFSFRLKGFAMNGLDGFGVQRFGEIRKFPKLPRNDLHARWGINLKTQSFHVSRELKEYTLFCIRVVNFQGGLAVVFPNISKSGEIPCRLRPQPAQDAEPDWAEAYLRIPK